MNTATSPARFLSRGLLTLASIAALLTISSIVSASEFDKKAPEFDSLSTPAVLTESEIQKQVAEQMRVQCDSQQRCWLMGSDSSGAEWKFGAGVGAGARNYNTGTTVINLGDDSSNGSNQPYWNLSISYRNYVCNTNLRIDPALKRLFTTYFMNAVNPDGSTKRTFSPAELGLFSLYATLNQKLDTCRMSAQ